MWVLRLGNSDDLATDVPEDQRNYVVAAQCLEEAVGEQVETVVRPIWPRPGLPDLVDQWLERYQPDFVFLKVTWYWYGYESVPLRIGRLLGRAGRPVARAATWAAASPRFSHQRWFKWGRRAAHRLIGGDSPFEPATVIARMEAVIRRVAAREQIVLVVKGTGGGRRDEGTLAGYYGNFARKRAFVEGSIERLCAQLHVTYVGTGPPKGPEDRDIDEGDGLHKGARGHNAMGRQEGEAMVAGWRASNGAAMQVQPAATSGRID